LTDTPDSHVQIIARYRRVAQLPDGLFFFTFPIRRDAVRRLGLVPGGSVLEVGCGSGANFPFLLEAVGSTGQVVGVDLSPEMIAAARTRVQRRGWSRIRLIESAAESLRLDEQFDALLLFAMHDVFTSPAGLDRSLAHVQPGGASSPSVGVGIRGSTGRILNRSWCGLPAFRLSRSLDRDRPWRLLAERVRDLHVEHLGPGVLFMAWGEVA
jgi:demethylmenaquinone methyltransferase/2-methoxy-6-polyprenyl-1,4-benzoquinol methylase